MQKKLAFNTDLCIGCKACELACSLRKDDCFSPARARLAALTFTETESTLSFNEVFFCRQCADAPCAARCKEGALHWAGEPGSVLVIDLERCTGCARCVTACPFGAMRFDAEQRKAVKCDVCAGDPACVAVCPTAALNFQAGEAFFARRKEARMRAYAYLRAGKRASLKRGKKQPAQ